MSNSSLHHIVPTGPSNSSSPAPLMLHPSFRRAWLIWLIVTLLTCFFGTLTNIVLFIVTLTYRKIRDSSSSPLIMHCTALDLYISAVVAPVTAILGYLGPSQYLPPQFCRFFGLGFYNLYNIHVWAGCILAFQRLIAAWRPLQYERLTTKQALTCMIVLPWLLGCLINTFPVFEIGTKVIPASFAGGCFYVSAGHSTSLLHGFSMYLPSTLMGIFYILIFCQTILASRRRASSQIHANMAVTLKRRLEITRMLFVSFIWFCVSMYPLTLVIAFFPQQYNTNIALHLIPRYLTASYSCLNPLFCFASSKLYMAGVRHLFSHSCRCGQVAPLFSISGGRDAAGRNSNCNSGPGTTGRVLTSSRRPSENQEQNKAKPCEPIS
ncbi:hypothetical protein BV898_00388 [Hypsibius exemplaris]|uniref:G-protein coupled receptors family 1 profile domain-containing protein n=1 Tax=Hypsibius exemplaris TaxID=2072580 RepID=A0A1W0XD94_HYPEX|nr:hypothetical protein BV898_00388 [Hypsibius exemplaris]